MILPDVNVLLYAHDTLSPDHRAARLWWEQVLSQKDPPIGLDWTVILGFLRISTNRRAVAQPFTATEATAIVRGWLAQPAVRVVVPGERHADILFGLLDELGVAGNLTTDAHLAALAIEYRAEIATADTDFGRFRGLRWFNPLKAGRRR
ncbi:MAG TPA: type II toxin-antitoxin system VapC family toxin [Bryobacteraceae bacterium]|nr:type II toxin-antitoxin system VapC family toxin [Bryobacteraceae bacterium]